MDRGKELIFRSTGKSEFRNNGFHLFLHRSPALLAYRRALLIDLVRTGEKSSICGKLVRFEILSIASLLQRWARRRDAGGKEGENVRIQTGNELEENPAARIPFFHGRVDTPCP